MKKVLVLATGWESDYWEKPRTAPYPKTNFSELSEWNYLSNNCPLPGIGRYIKQKENDFSTNPFVYLRIKGLSYDSNTNAPYFSFEPIKKAILESCKLSKILSSNRLFFSVDAEEIIRRLKEIGENIPYEWLELVGEIKEEAIDWKSFIGEYFLKISMADLSNDEFEDRIAKLLIALGFNVKQKGHKIKGEYPDGIAMFSRDSAIVYDCKNSDLFKASSADKRAIMKYLYDEENLNPGKRLFPAFIAKNVKEGYKDKIFYMSVESLLYLFYKKILLGENFSLDPFKKIFDNNSPLNIDIIENEWMIS